MNQSIEGIPGHNENNHPWIRIGKIVAAKGLQGQLKVNPSSDFPERFTKAGPRWLQAKNNEPREIQLISGHQLPGKSLYIVRFKGIENRIEAEALIGEILLVPSNNRPKLKEGEFHLLDLIDLEVRLDKEGKALGHVRDLNTAGNDLLTIELIHGKKVLVPFVLEIVPEVNLKEGWLLIKPPPGLLEL